MRKVDPARVQDVYFNPRKCPPQYLDLMNEVFEEAYFAIAEESGLDIRYRGHTEMADDFGWPVPYHHIIQFGDSEDYQGFELSQTLSYALGANQTNGGDLINGSTTFLNNENIGYGGPRDRLMRLKGTAHHEGRHGKGQPHAYDKYSIMTGIGVPSKLKVLSRFHDRKFMSELYGVPLNAYAQATQHQGINNFGDPTKHRYMWIHLPLVYMDSAYKSLTLTWDHWGSGMQHFSVDIHSNIPSHLVPASIIHLPEFEGMVLNVPRVGYQRWIYSMVFTLYRSPEQKLMAVMSDAQPLEEKPIYR